MLDEFLDLRIAADYQIMKDAHWVKNLNTRDLKFIRNYSIHEFYLPWTIKPEFGNSSFSCSVNILSGTTSYYLGVHTYTLILALRYELGWHYV